MKPKLTPQQAAFLRAMLEVLERETIQVNESIDQTLEDLKRWRIKPEPGKEPVS